MKRNMSLSQELDLTRDGTAEMTRWCIIIALHQCFGVGKDRLNKIEARAEALAYESLDVAMTANDDQQEVPGCEEATSGKRNTSAVMRT